MGNNLSAVAPSTARTPNGADSYLGELGGEVQYEKSMGTSRFLKTIRARHQHGALVVKMFVKADPAISLKAIHRRLKAEREALADCPNLLPYQRVLETERAGYLIRQWVASNLYDRISTRPFLSSVEKRWVAYQLLTGLAHAREHNISHGDIKTENVVVTSWNWVYVTDFASFKPTHLPLDDPSTFSLFFDTSSRRTCYLAPERFYTAGSDVAKRKDKLEWGKRDGKITEAMDVFGLGCVLAELWMEGTPPFTLSQIYKYRAGEYSPESYLAEIEDEDIRTLIRSMISLDPGLRLSFAQYLEKYRGSAFPEIFYDFLHPFLSSLNESNSSTPTPSASTPPNVPTSSRGTSTPSMPASKRENSAANVTLRSDADDRIETIWSEWEVIRGHLEGNVKPFGMEEDRRPEAAESSKAGSDLSFFPMRLHIPGLEGEEVGKAEGADGPALILLSVVCSNIRNCLRPASVIRALEILLALGIYLTDETKLDRLVPYLVACLQDDMASVRAAALKALTQTLILINVITPSNAAIFPEYILPNCRPFSTDPEILPRVTYAQCIAHLAQTAARFLEMTEAMKSEGTFKLAFPNDFDGSPYEATYDQNLAELRSHVQDHINPLLTDSSTIVKRALLSNIGVLCSFFGRINANDAILAHLVTYLNTRDWLLRAEWNETAVAVAECVGPKSLEEYILPLISLSLADAEEFVVAKVLTSLTRLADRRLLTKGKIWELVNQVTGLLCHPNIWIREGAAAFLASIARLLQPTDRWCTLYPTLKRLLRADIKEITEISLLDNAREPLSRTVFEAAVAWAGRSGKSNFWSLQRVPTKRAPREASVRTDEDHAQLEKMRTLGMKPEDEYKLSAMREHISKVASARLASSSRFIDAHGASDPLFQTGGAILTDLGIVPQTIFFSIKPFNDHADTRSVGSRLTSGSFNRRTSVDTDAHSIVSADSARPRAVRKMSSGQPLDDLRRRLAMAGLSSAPPTADHMAESGANAQSATSEGVADIGSNLPLTLQRTVSQTSSSQLSDSPIATRDIVQAKERSRVSSVGVEVGRVTAAIGEDSTNAIGLFNVESRHQLSTDDARHNSKPQSPISKLQMNRLDQTQRVTSTYDGNDASIKQLLERICLDSYQQPSFDLGDHVLDGIPRRKALRTSFPPRERTPSRPEGILIAHLVEHTAAITDIRVSPDQLFFVTASEDGTVKVWDTIRLEKNVTSKSRQTFNQGGKITAMCLLAQSHCIASASSNGTLWIHRVDVSLSGSMPKYGKPQLVRQQSSDEPEGYITCLASFKFDMTLNLVYGTSLSTITVLDVATMRKVQVFSNPRQFGPITSICIDPKHVWVVVGTGLGTLALWDLRFGLLLRSWTVCRRRIYKIALHPCRGKGRWVVVTYEPEARNDSIHVGLVTDVWDLDLGSKVEEYVVLSPNHNGNVLRKLVEDNSATAMKEATLDPSAAIESLLSSGVSSPPSTDSRQGIKLSDTLKTSGSLGANTNPGVMTFLVGIDYSLQTNVRPSTSAQHPPEVIESDGVRDVGYMITAGEDRKIRFWDLSKISRSSVVIGLDTEEDKPSYSSFASNSLRNLFAESSAALRSRFTGNPASNKVHRSTLIANSQQQLVRGHQDAITALAIIDLPFRCLVSGDRSGVVKVFE